VAGPAPGDGPPASHLLGREGERLAARFLEGRGYRVLGTGFRARRGEIDLICRRGDRLGLVEVKTGSSDRFGAPVEAVGPRERGAVQAAAAEYRTLAGWRGPIEWVVVSVRPGQEPELIEEPW